MPPSRQEGAAAQRGENLLMYKMIDRGSSCIFHSTMADQSQYWWWCAKREDHHLTLQQRTRTCAAAHPLFASAEYILIRSPSKNTNIPKGLGVGCHHVCLRTPVHLPSL